MAKKVLSDLDFNSVSRIQNLPSPASSSEPATKGYVDSAVEGLAWKDSARVATQGNLNLSSPGASIDGIALTSGDRVLVMNQTATEENGLYIWSGAAVAMSRADDASTAAELEQAVVTVEEGTSAGTTYRQTSINFVLGSGAISFSLFGATVPNASETTPGKIEIATQGEVDAGTDTERAVTPATLASWSNRIRKTSGNLGDGASTQFDITHNFGTRAVTVEIFRNSSPWDTVFADIARPDTNTVRINFAAAPTSNQFSYVITA